MQLAKPKSQLFKKEQKTFISSLMIYGFFRYYHVSINYSKDQQLLFDIRQIYRKLAEIYFVIHDYEKTANYYRRCCE